MDIEVQLLVGTKVRDVNGANVGRIEEIRVVRHERALLVEAYLIGVSGLIDRLSARTLVRPVRRLLRSRHIYSVYEVPWQDMDLSDPKRPMLTIAQHDLRHAR